jgi:glyoxylase-like metal-dependent hydrolase (beta-lactamase superfamily II)
MAKKKQLIENVNNNITRINFAFVGMYVFKDNSNAICIDTGVNVKDVEAGFKELNMDPKQVDAVLLTHSDRDHTGGVSLFTNANVYISADEEQMINGSTARFFKFVRNKKPGCELNYLKDGDELKFGNISVKCISTPGHTPGSMSFLINGKYLFAGDILNLEKGAAVMDRGFLQMDRKLQEKSIRKLAKLHDIELLLTAHKGFTNNFEKAMVKWI